MKVPAFDVLLSHTVDRDVTPPAFGLTVKLIDTFTSGAPTVVAESQEFSNMIQAMEWIHTEIPHFAERAGLLPDKTPPDEAI